MKICWLQFGFSVYPSVKGEDKALTRELKSSLAVRQIPIGDSQFSFDIKASLRYLHYPLLRNLNKLQKYIFLLNLPRESCERKRNVCILAAQIVF